MDWLFIYLFMAACVFVWNIWLFCSVIYRPQIRLYDLPLKHHIALLLIGFIMSLIIAVAWPLCLVAQLYQVVVDFFRK